MNKLYHGSFIPNIKTLQANSRLHNTDSKVLYLTDNIPYSLFYVWDGEHNRCSSKHVTGWLKNGTAFYEEQFSCQLETFYKGVAGYLYSVSMSDEVQLMNGRDDLYYCLSDMAVEESTFIPDVYEELIKYEKTGELEIRRFNKQSEERQNELTELIAQTIIRENFFENSPKEKREFYKSFFVKSWELALKIKPQYNT